MKRMGKNNTTKEFNIPLLWLWTYYHQCTFLKCSLLARPPNQVPTNVLSGKYGINSVKEMFHPNLKIFMGLSFEKEFHQIGRHRWITSCLEHFRIYNALSSFLFFPSLIQTVLECQDNISETAFSCFLICQESKYYYFVWLILIPWD